VTSLPCEHGCKHEAIYTSWLVQNGKLLLASTASGCVRAYKYPLTGEFSELRCHSSSISCMRCFFDETLLFTAGDDGAVFVFDVRQDIKGAGIKRDAEKLPFADEVMVTKSDLEEKKSRYGCARLACLHPQIRSLFFASFVHSPEGE
jgi:cilia- and flagella-associated protein 57